MYSLRDTLAGGLPHSEIPGSTIARISPGLIAACHALHRLSVPRHPPDALTLLDYAQQNPPLTGTSPTSDVRLKTLFTSKTRTTREPGKHTKPATEPVSVTLSLHPVKEPADSKKAAGKPVFHDRVGACSCKRPAAAGASLDAPGAAPCRISLRQSTKPPEPLSAPSRSRRNKSYGCRGAPQAFGLWWR